MQPRQVETSAPALERSPVEAGVVETRALLQAANYAGALASAQALARLVPENRDVLYMIAVSQRYLGQTREAHATLDRLETAHPQFSRLHQERGHCFIAEGRPGDAMEAYLRAVNLSPALPASWNALHILFRSSKRTAEAGMAAGHVAKLRSLAPEIVTASSMFADGEVHEAERIIRNFLRTHPDDIEAMRLLARIGIKLDVLDDAEFLLESVLTFAPDTHLARYDYARVLLQRHRHSKAFEQSKILLKADPGGRDFRAIYAAACVAIGFFDEALAVYRSLADGASNSAEMYLSIGHTLKTLGQYEEAVGSYRRAAELLPSFGDAYWSLANLKTYRFQARELERMRAEEARYDVGVADRTHLCFALGKALEDRREYAESFAYYKRGNALRKHEINYRAEVIERNARLQEAVCEAAFFSDRRNAGSDSREPIFIVGLPRAGSTLLEQILASHTQIDGTMELADISRLVVRLQGRTHDESAPAYPAVLRQLTPDQLRQLGEKYLADTQVYRSGKPLFIDKNPNNFRHLGLISLILPNARIIDARRDPMACCFSNFKQLFAAGQEFTYDLQDIGRYYRSYVQLMAHWDAVLPGKVLRVMHEDVVADLEGSVRRILEFLNLPFEPACLDFHKTARSVRTASSEQVRQPIFKDGLENWRPYEEWLGPLKRALAGTDLND